MAKSATESKSSAPTIVKAVLLGFGALALISIGLSLFKLAVIAMVIGGVGYGGYRLLGGGKQLGDGDDGSGRPQRRLSAGSGDSNDELARRMKELDALDKKLDEQLAKLDDKKRS